MLPVYGKDASETARGQSCLTSCSLCHLALPLPSEVFQCCQAATALAKRGENIVRCFIGVSPGGVLEEQLFTSLVASLRFIAAWNCRVLPGVGQSLYSAHLDAVYSPNHKFIDPNIWYDETEMRKQVEQAAGAFILTAQEAPETQRRMREDLYKKTMSADGIAGRKPYGMSTHMIELIGWKRCEVNRLMRFMGVTEANFPSILRRSLVWKPMARFINAHIIKKTTPMRILMVIFGKMTLSKIS